jgi:hypothetical protein
MVGDMNKEAIVHFIHIATTPSLIVMTWPGMYLVGTLCLIWIMAVVNLYSSLD